MLLETPTPVRWEVTVKMTSMFCHETVYYSTYGDNDAVRDTRRCVAVVLDIVYC